MFKNYLLLAFRNLLKRKVYSFINIFGLAIGVAVCLIILKYVDFELSYDSFNTRADRIYRVNNTYYQNGELNGSSVISSYALGPALLADIPEVKTFIRTHPMYGGCVVTYKRDSGDPTTFYETKVQMVDSVFFDVFTYSSVHGDLATALDNPNSIVITKTVAEKYFGKEEDPIGKVLQLSGGWSDGDYEVTAVIKDVPQNSHFTFEIILPIHNVLRGGQYTQDDGWGWNNFVTYVELHPQTNAKTAEKKLPAFVEKYRGKDLAQSKSNVVFNFQPIRAIHLTPGLAFESGATISSNTIYFFVIISIFILAIAWVNYINLSTARAMERAREVGIKKAVGAFKSQLLSQFIFESVLVNFFGVALAMAMAIGLLPLLGEIVNKELTFDFTDYRFWSILFGLFLVGSFISGFYPALMLSSFNTIDVLKGKTEKITGGFSLRKVLVVFQFASSLILIAGTFTIYRQVMFMRDSDKGLTMEQMLIVNGPRVVQWPAARQQLITLKETLREIPGVLQVATSGSVPGAGYNWGTRIRKDGAAVEDQKDGRIVWVDPDFIKTYGITVIAGRTFDPSIKSDMESVLINQAALTEFGLGDAESALKERVILGDDTVAVLGVLKNYHWASLKTDHTPWLFKADTISSRSFSIHLNGKNINETIRKVEKEYKEAFPGNPFDYYFLDDSFNSQYQDEQQFARLFTLFAILAIIIACLGLWGLASFTTTQKLKEIGIRKVMGASVSGIISLLSWQFLKLVAVASLIAIPLTWYGIDAWLGNFAFRIGLRWDLFVVPVVILCVLALSTVSLQILRGARTNPAKILRSE
jgi:putative ABC transport system permease protein